MSEVITKWIIVSGVIKRMRQYCHQEGSIPKEGSFKSGHLAWSIISKSSIKSITGCTQVE